MKWMSTYQLANTENVTPQTIRRWVKQGHYPNTKLTKGSDLRIGIDCTEETILYARVSTSKQKKV